MLLVALRGSHQLVYRLAFVAVHRPKSIAAASTVVCGISLIWRPSDSRVG